MSPEDIKALRRELKCTAGELADALGTDQKTVKAWEQEDLFPTKRSIRDMERLRDQGASAIRKRRRKKAPTREPLDLLSDPDLWRVVRKLLAHAELRDAVTKLADDYDDPTG